MWIFKTAATIHEGVRYGADAKHLKAMLSLNWTGSINILAVRPSPSRFSSTWPSPGPQTAFCGPHKPNTQPRRPRLLLCLGGPPQTVDQAIYSTYAAALLKKRSQDFLGLDFSTKHKSTVLKFADARISIAHTLSHLCFRVSTKI